MFHLYVDGQRITDEPMTLEEINNAFGSVQKLEAEGIRIVEFKEKVTLH